MGIEHHSNLRRSAERGGGKECIIKKRSAKTGRGAPNRGKGAQMGIQECSPRGEAPNGGVWAGGAESSIEATTQTQEHWWELRSSYPC